MKIGFFFLLHAIALMVEWNDGSVYCRSLTPQDENSGQLLPINQFDAMERPVHQALKVANSENEMKALMEAINEELVQTREKEGKLRQLQNYLMFQSYDRLSKKNDDMFTRSIKRNSNSQSLNGRDELDDGDSTSQNSYLFYDRSRKQRNNQYDDMFTRSM